MQCASSNDEIHDILNTESKGTLYEDILQRCGITQVITVSFGIHTCSVALIWYENHYVHNICIIWDFIYHIGQKFGKNVKKSIWQNKVW